MVGGEVSESVVVNTFPSAVVNTSSSSAVVVAAGSKTIVVPEVTNTTSVVVSSAVVEGVVKVVSSSTVVGLLNSDDRSSSNPGELKGDDETAVELVCVNGVVVSSGVSRIGIVTLPKDPSASLLICFGK